MPNRSSFHAGQYVKVRVSTTSTEVGQIEALDDDKAKVLTSSGFAVSRGIAALEPAWLIVLDLNGVLGYRKTSKMFKKRPHVDAMLTFLFANFAVGVWTSCAEHNGVRIIRDVFGEELEGRLIFRMFRDECTPNPTPDNAYGTFKDLRRVWDRYPYFDATNTIMVDDSEDKCSHRHNALCPTPYTGEESEGTAADDGLQEIMAVLAEVLVESTFEPVRRHMLARWSKEDDLSRQQSAAVTPVDQSACGPTDAFPASGPSNAAVMPPSSPFARLPQPSTQPSSVATGARPDGGRSKEGGGNGKRSETVSKVVARSAARIHAEQDANDSDEDAHRPSVGNTPPTGGSSLPLSQRMTPPTHHEPIAGSTAHGLLFGPTAGGRGKHQRGSATPSRGGTSPAPPDAYSPQASTESLPNAGGCEGGGRGVAAGAAAPAPAAAKPMTMQERMRAIAMASAGKHAGQGGKKRGA